MYPKPTFTHRNLTCEISYILLYRDCIESFTPQTGRFVTYNAHEQTISNNDETSGSPYAF
jgi:hypothetical protein